MESNTKTNSNREQAQPEGKLISVGDLLSYLARVKDKRKRRSIRCKLEIIWVYSSWRNCVGKTKRMGSPIGHSSTADGWQNHCDWNVKACHITVPIGAS